MPSRGQSGVATVMEWNTVNNTFQSGNAAATVLWFVKDGVLTTPANQAAITEISGSGGGPLGAYAIAFTSAEATCNTLWIGGQSSTANVAIIPITLTFEQLPVAALGANNGLITVGSGIGQMTMMSGFANVDVNQWQGLPPNALINGLVQATFSGTTPAVNVTQIAGVATVGAPGYVGIDWSQIANPTTPQVLTATTFSGLINSPAVTITGITSQAQFGVNVVTWRGASPSPLIAGLVQAAVSGTPGTNVLTWLGSTPAALTGAGYVQADLETWRTVVPNTLQSGRVDSTIGQVQPNAISTVGFVPGALTTTVFGAPFLTSASYDTTYSNGLADALGNRANAIELGLTPYQSWQLVAASQGGVLSGALTPTVVIDGAGVATTRITATCDNSGNRLAVTLTL